MTPLSHARPARRPTRAPGALLAVLALHATAALLLLAGGLDGQAPLAIGLLGTAYLTGVRHSYDWDHISTIDNTTRRFVELGRDPRGVGLAFSLGHSSVVMAAGVLVVLGASFVTDLVTGDDGTASALGLFGAGVSGLFLLLMGLYNAAAALRVGRAWAAARAGLPVEPTALKAQGLVSRLLARPLDRVHRTRHVYTVGLLFGLGFDTASTVSLLILTASASLAGVSPWTLAALPVLFTAGMCLCDALNGLMVTRMYRTAWQDPLSRLGFNTVLTGISALSALLISVITLGGAVHEGLGLSDPVTAWLAEIDLGDAGLLLVLATALVWGCAALLWRRDHSPRTHLGGTA